MLPAICKTPVRLIAAVLLAMTGASGAHAAGGNSTNGEWEFQLAPLFLWAQGIEGEFYSSARQQDTAGHQVRGCLR